jgi:hypothetical protein
MNVQASEDFIDHWNNSIKIAQDSLMTAQQRQTNYANQNRRDLQLKKGDKVLISAAHVNNPVDAQRPTKKLSPKYLGPYEVIECISPVAYKLKLPASIKIHPVVHVSVLKPYQEEKDFSRPVPPPPEIIDDEIEFEVERILDKRIRYRKPEYLVKWKGYPLHDATWEPQANLTNCRTLLNEFNQRGR